MTFIIWLSLQLVTQDVIGEILIYMLIFLKNIKIYGSSNLMYSRSLNYQWDLDDTATEYYHPGNDVNNFHMTLKLAYLIPLAN